MTSSLPSYDLDLKLAEFKINGFCIFEDLMPVEKIDRIREAFTPLLEAVRARDDPEPSGDRRTGEGRRQETNRYTVEVPWKPPFSDPELYENRALLEFLDRYWGASDYLITAYSSNTPYPGSVYQRWHRDTGLIAPHVGLQLFPIIAIKFPLVDTAEANGSFEVLPGTQYIADPELETRYDDVLEAGEFPAKRRLNMKRGTFWVQDIRTVHRGTPNGSDYPRPELVVVYNRPWHTQPRHIEMTQAEFDRLSERGKQMLARCRIH